MDLTIYFLCTGLQHLYCPRMEDEEYGVSTVDKFRLTYDGPDLEIIERIRRMYERVPFGKSKDEEVEGDRKKKRRKPKFLIRLKTDPEFKRKIILTAGLLWSFMILVGGGKTNISFIIFFPLYVIVIYKVFRRKRCNILMVRNK